jgi:hypothetical protein
VLTKQPMESDCLQSIKLQTFTWSKSLAASTLIHIMRDIFFAQMVAFCYRKTDGELLKKYSLPFDSGKQHNGS